MVRPREFDETEAVDAALGVFWRLGYDGCSIRDLVEATGVQRQSLYNTFTDKHGLFLKVLARYQEHVESALAPLEATEAGLDDARRYMQDVLAMQRARGVGVCLMIKTAFTPARADERIRVAVERGARTVQEALADLMRRAAERGEMAEGSDAGACAAYLFSVLHGASALAASGAGDAQVSAVLTRAFDSIAPPRRAKTTKKKPGRKKR